MMDCLLYSKIVEGFVIISDPKSDNQHPLKSTMLLSEISTMLKMEAILNFQMANVIVSFLDVKGGQILILVQVSTFNTHKHGLFDQNSAIFKNGRHLGFRLYSQYGPNEGTKTKEHYKFGDSVIFYYCVTLILVENVRHLEK